MSSSCTIQRRGSSGIPLEEQKPERQGDYEYARPGVLSRERCIHHYVYGSAALNSISKTNFHSRSGQQNVHTDSLLPCKCLCLFLHLSALSHLHSTDILLVLRIRVYLLVRSPRLDALPDPASYCRPALGILFRNFLRKFDDCFPGQYSFRPDF